MAISLLLKSATGALFLAESGASNDRQGCALQGFVSFPQGEGSSGSQLRLESTARLDGMHGARLRYQLTFGRGLAGFMFLVSSKRRVTDPDYTGFVGQFDELIVTGWNRSMNDRPYVLLNVRENGVGEASSLRNLTVRSLNENLRASHRWCEVLFRWHRAHRFRQA